MVDTVLSIAFMVFRYSLVGGIAAFLGWFIGDQAKTRAVPRWTSWLAIIAFGALVWHAPEFAAGLGSNSQLSE